MSTVHPLFESLIKPVRPGCEFVFDGIKGSVDTTGYVFWGGMGFQIESAGPALRAVIDAVRNRPIMIEVPRVEIEETLKALTAAAEKVDIDRPKGLGKSMLANQINASIRGLTACLAKQ